MSNSQKGFIPLILLVIIAVVAIGGGTYYYTHNKNQTQKSENDIDNHATTPTKTNPPSSESTSSDNQIGLYADHINTDNNTPANTVKSFSKNIRPGEIVSGPKLAYTRNGLKIQTNYFVGTTSLNVKQIDSDSVFVKEGPYEYHIQSNSQCGACALAALNIYYFNFKSATSTLAYTFPARHYDLNDTDFVISADWKKITDYEYELKDNVANPYDYDNYKKNYQWNATSYCFKDKSQIFEECGIKYNIQPPSPRNFAPSRQDF
jgi:hypothetical protein